MTPVHVAIIMDGNGRWATSRGLPRLKGHEAGADSVGRVLRASRDAGVKFLTLYAFSVENWSRPKSEVMGLMELLGRFLDEHMKDLHKYKTRLLVSGRRSDLPKSLLSKLETVERETACYAENATLVLALSYGGRTEIAHAAASLARKAAAGLVDPDSIDEKMLSSEMYHPEVPDPDLIIRTSGEFRISNFLLWECAYSEFYITDVLWPDFTEQDFKKALESYAGRSRRFGGVTAAEPEGRK